MRDESEGDSIGIVSPVSDASGHEVVCEPEAIFPNPLISDTCPSSPSGFSISAEIAPKVTFATEQAGIAILRDLVVANHGKEDLEAVDIEISADPPFLTSRVWRIDRIVAGCDFSMRDRNVELDRGFLFGLTEAISATVTIKARRAGVRDSRELVWEERHSVRILARNEWGGAGTMPELLASFVQPNDPGSERLVKAAAEALRAGTIGADGPRLDGYASGKRQHVWSMVNALWVAVGRLGLDYSVPPTSFELEGQKIRRPADVVSSGLATCLDAVMLFASALEQMSLHPLLILVKGHAFVGVWLAPEKFASIVGEDVVDVRKRVDLGDILVVETTLAVRHPPAPFSRAVDHAKKALKDLGEDDPDFRVIDVARARALRYTPLPSFESASYADAGETGKQEIVSLAIEAPPALPDFDRKDETPVSETPDSRVERWKRRLLDLSLRNKMLNWRPGKGSIPILCRDVPRLEDMLAEGREFRVRDLPDLGLGTREGEDGRRDEEIVRRRLGEPIVDSAVDEGLENGLLYSDLTQKDVEARQVELFRKARNDLQEGGANTLFIAAGMLRWKKSPNDSRSYRAPLVLIPVQMERNSVRSPMRLKQHDDEPRFNATLLQMLKADFDIAIPALDGDLPMDESGIDLTRIFAQMREAVKDVPGFEVEAGQLVLSTFSFAKYLMWKDLQDRADQLKENGLVRHLIDTARESFSDGLEFPEAGELDAKYAPKDFFLVKPADSSQLRAVAAGAEGKNYVMIGPPGTGKSQTITNLISQCLGMGKTVLFFAEKTAALEVVYRRLREEGLGDFCLEVHSNKARKLDVLEQLEKAWEASGDFTEDDWTKEAERLAELRNQLNGFVAALHRRHQNGWSAFRALSIVVAGDGLDSPKLSWPSTGYHDTSAYEAIERVADDLQISGKEVRELTGSVFEAISQAEWSPSFQNNIVERAQKVIAAVDRCVEMEARFLEAASLKEPLEGRIRRRDYWERGLVRLAETLSTVQGLSCDLVFSSSLNDLVAERERVIQTLHQYAEEKASLIGSYKDNAESRLNLETLRDQAALSRNAWWPKSLFILGPVIKAMRAESSSGKISKSVAFNDLPILECMASHRQVIDVELEPLLRGLGRIWKGVDTDVDQVEDAVERLVAVRDAASFLAGNVERIGRVQAVLSPLLTTAKDMLATTGAVGRASESLRTAFNALKSALDEFEHIARGRIDRDMVDRAEEGWIEGLRTGAVQLVGGEAAIHRWCNWRRDRIEGQALGLGPILEGVERGTVQVERIVEVVRLAYARWWLAALVDQDQTLKEFSASRHEHTIQRFRELDDRFHALTRQYLRAKIASSTPKRGEAQRGSEYAVLQRELSKKRNHKPLRQLIAEMPTALLNLTPCLLMSPLSVAQYLAANDDLFDVAIIDEGSQVTVWDAIGPLARAKQAIIVGDPKQLPPTSFFQRADDDEAAGDEAIDEDLESILDEAIGANVPTLHLEWHYRSRSESLIAFSNQLYYENRLVTFPSPQTEDKAVHLIRVEQGTYERGKGGTRTNPAEARAIVAEIASRLLAQAHLPKERQLSFGVVTFNAEQQRLIENLLDEEVRRDPAIEQFFEVTLPEPVMVKNLESVQGDERDVMMFSITYGPDQSGRLSMNFGPLNRQGGERRLNVAITRARHELLVFSSIGAGDIDLSRSAAIGVHDLKHFLDYAERGARALGERVAGSMGGHDSPFEAAVAEALSNRGWRLIPQVGVGGFRIDLGVVHPDAPGRFLAGIEADGATYHSGRTARDRDYLREQVLRSLGWEIIRIWSTDWWIDRRSALEAVDTRLKEILEDDRLRMEEMRERAAADEARREDIQRRLRESDVVAEDGTDEDSDVEEGTESVPNARIARPATLPDVATPVPQVRQAGDGKYHKIIDVAELFGVTAEEVKAFRTEAVRPRVLQILAAIMDAEGPVERLGVISRVAKGFGYSRAGPSIRTFIEGCMPMRLSTQDGDVEFMWPAGSEPRIIPFRVPTTEEDRRLVKDIAIEELIGLAESLPADLSEDAAVDRMARTIGIARVTSGARERMVRAWASRRSNG